MTIFNRIAPALLTFLRRIALPVLIVLIFVLVIVFTAANPGEMSIRFLHWDFSWPVSFVLTGTFALGWLFGLLCMGVYAVKVAFQRRKARRKLEISETEVSNLRSLPLNDAD